jgi:tetratricopeptide (TPR) repeat protein
LRVNVQLIDAHTDKHLWSESYDRTLDDAFSIQSDVAQHIVEAVGVALAESERTAYGAAPTDNAEAYQLYLQGREYQRRLSGDNKEALAIAQQLYERAIELDPDFALAHASLSEVHGVMYWAKHDPLPARPDAQLREAQTALRLDPDLPEAHFAMGFWHYVARRDWQAALDQYAIAARGMPNDAHLIERIGYTHRRMGNWKGVFEAFERAIRIEPRNATLHYDLAGHTYRLTRQFDEASRAYARALSLSPDFHDAAVAKGLAHLALSGELDTLRAVLERIPSNDPWWYRGAIVLLFLERDADSVLSVLRRRGASTVAWDDRFVPTSLTAGRAHLVRGDTTSAMAAFDSALVVLDSALLVLGDDWRVHASRGWALAGLGRRNEAMDEARWLQDSEEYRDDAFMRSDLGLSRASILTLLGEHDLALDEIEQELARPSWLSVNGLRLSPTWDGLRDDPRFQQLLAAYD